MKDDIDTIYFELKKLYADISNLYELNDKLSSKIDNFTEIDTFTKIENKSSNNYPVFIFVVSAFISLFISGICCGISCSDRVKVEETPTEMRINLDNPQNKNIELDINHG